MMQRNRGQLQHMFGFILIGIVLTVTLLMGYTFISALLDVGCDKQLPKFVDEIEQIATVYDSFGTRQMVTLPSVCKATHLCILRNGTEYSDITTALPSGAVTPTVETQLATTRNLEEEENVYLIIDNTVTPVSSQVKFLPFDENPATPDPLGALCVKNYGGNFPLRVDGKGRVIEVRDGT